ncbi:MAG: response regulator transcription factor [Bacteroidetes bacterium]|nr:response regulator transcription factor [Bacteroidota bacterium]
MIKAIIIDDEERARILLKGMIKEFVEEVEVLAECPDLPTGIKAIKKYAPDIVFLDIEMPGHSGLELLDFFNENEVNFDIIFVTAYNQYAIKAFKLSAIDYLLKPIEIDELQESIKRYKSKQKKQQIDYQVLRENFNSPMNEKIAIPVGNAIKFIELKNIIYLKADSSYSELYFEDGTKLVVSRTLKNFEEVLTSENGFLRCHKSYLVNINSIVEYVKSDGGYVVLKNGANLTISPEKTSELLDMLKMVKR